MNKENEKCRYCDGTQVSIVRVNRYKKKNGIRVKMGTTRLDYRCKDCMAIISKMTTNLIAKAQSKGTKGRRY